MSRVLRTSSLFNYSVALVVSMLALLFVVPGLRANLFSIVGNGETFMRHDECYHFVGALVYTHFISDLLIGLSYVAISTTLAYLVHRARRDIPFHWVFLAFGLFIVACGSTHFMEAWTTFRAPVYWLAGYLKLVTAVASVATAVVLPPLVPRTLALVRDAKLSEQHRLELEAANRELEAVYSRDVEQALAEAREATRKLTAIIEASPLAIVTLDAAGRVKSWNPAAEHIYGWTEDEVLDQPLPTVPPSARAEMERNHDAAMHGKTFSNFETERLRKDGSTVEVSISTAPLFNDEGHPAGVLALVADITEPKRAESKMFQLAAIVESSDDAIISKNLDGIIQSWNPAAERLYGYTAAEAVGQPVTMLIPPERPDEEPRIIERIKRGERVDHYETTRVCKDGTRLKVSLTVSPVKDAQGRITGASKIARDITERTRAEDEQKFLNDATTVLASSLDYAATLDTVGHMAARYVADYCLVDLVEDDGAITRLIVAHRDPEREAAWREMQRRFPLNPAADYTIPHVLRTGESLLYSHSTDELLERALSDREQIDTLKSFGITSSMIVPLTARGRTLGAVTFIAAEPGRHYTARELRVAEEFARRAALAVDNARLFERAQEANRSKDEFLATLSHELRTPLTPIVGWVHLLGGGQVSPADFRHGLAVIDKNSQSLSHLINDLLDMSAILNGKMRIDRAPVFVGQAVREAVETVRAQANTRRVGIEVEGCGEDNLQSMISGDRTRLVQVFWNLLSNAVKFSDDGGTVRVSCAREAASITISVEDEGIGIATEFLPHVFDRFRQADMSTTKLYGGLGIGLALVRSFTEAHGGTVRAESTGLGRGSRFIVTLPTTELRNADRGSRNEAGSATTTSSTSLPSSPTSDDQKFISSNPQSAIRDPQSPRRVLIVEDAPDTLEMLSRFFASRGYEATTCAEASEALDVATRAHFDIIVTDIGLPHIDGYELLRRLRRESPHLAHVPALALTGYAAEADVAAARAAGFDAHLPKPFEPASLAEAVERLLLARQGEQQGSAKAGE